MNKTETVMSVCLNCTREEVCLQNFGKIVPKCLKIKDFDDPTGCGGLCKINEQYCRLLDANFGIRACLNLRQAMSSCASGYFKCVQIHMCVKDDKRCDGVINCYDKSDEMGCGKF